MQLLQEIGRDKRNIYGAILTTYPFDPLFFEGMIRRILLQKNCRRNIVVLLDSSKYDLTMSPEISKTLRFVGRDYSLAPIRLGGMRVFHPKIFYFASPVRVKAFVGSANLTLQGFASNAELVTTFECEKADTKIDDGEILKEIRDFLSMLLTGRWSQSIGEQARSKIERIIESCNWLDKKIKMRASRDRTTWFLHNLDESILQQVGRIIEIIEGKPNVSELLVIAPFFGEDNAVLEQLDKIFNPPVINVFIQKGKTSVPFEQLDKWVKQRKNVAFLVSKKQERNIHGKMFLFKMKNGHSYCLSGSANASMSALLASTEKRGNIEACILRFSKTPEYFDYLLKDVVLSSYQRVRKIEAEDVTAPPHIGDQISETLESKLILDNATLSGIFLKLTIRSAEEPLLYFSGLKLITNSKKSFSFDRDDQAVVIPPHLEGSLLTLTIHASDELLEALKTPCQIVVRLKINGAWQSSTKRWVDVQFSDVDDIISDGISSDGTRQVPEHLATWLLSREMVDSAILHALAGITEGLRTRSIRERHGERGFERTRMRLPPQWSEQLPQRSNITGVIKFFFDIYDYNLKFYIEQIKAPNPWVEIEEFCKFLTASNKLSAILYVTKHLKAHRFAQIPRTYLISNYDGPSSNTMRLVEKCSSYLTDPKEIRDFYSFLMEKILPELIGISLVCRKEAHPAFGKRIQEAFAKSGLFLSGLHHLNLNFLSDENFEKLRKGLFQTFQEYFSRIAHKGLKEYIEKEYLNMNSLRKAILQFFAMMLKYGSISFIDRSISIFKQDIVKLQRKPEINRYSAFFAEFWKELKTVESVKKEQIQALIRNTIAEWQKEHIEGWKIKPLTYAL